MICAAVVLAGVFLVFGRTVTFDFVGGWDDGPLIYQNPMINPPTAASLGRIWREPHARMYVPAVYSTWWAIAHVAQMENSHTPDDDGLLNPYVFHAANVLVHAAAALIVFAILRILVRHDWPAAAGALLFALHPLQVEPVAWATGMKDLLGGMLSLAAVWQYLHYTTDPQRPQGRRGAHYAAATALFALALLAKPSAVVVPFMLIAIEWLMLGRPIGRAAGALLPWIVMSLAWMYVTATVQPTPEIPTPPLDDRLLIAANSVGFYVRKLFWPATLGIDYGLRPDAMLWRALLIFAIVPACAIAFSGSRWLLASAVLFVIALAPTMGLRPFVFQWLSTVADRYAYLALLGPAIAVAMLVSEYRSRPAVVWACAAVLALLGGRSFVQAGVWRDRSTLMHHALSVNPDSPLALNHVGDELFKSGDLPAAEDHFVRAVRLAPTYLSARDNLAVTLLNEGRHREALRLLQETVAMKQALPPVLTQPIDRDLKMIAAAERALAATHPMTHPTTMPTRRTTRPAAK
jgi:hypothetical protein